MASRVARGIHPRSGRGGFTLVEIVISIGIFALGMTGVLSLFVYATAAHHRAVNSVEVNLLAQEIMAQYAANLFDTDATRTRFLAKDFDTKKVVDALPAADRARHYLDGDTAGEYAFVMSVNYPRLWYAVALREWPDGDMNSDAVRMILKITTAPWAAGAANQVEQFETVLLKKPRP